MVSSFGEKMKRLRETSGETQEDIAKLLRISRAAVSKYESGDREPDIETIKSLAKHFNVTVDYIFGLSDLENMTGYYYKNSDGAKAGYVHENSGSKNTSQSFSSEASGIELLMKDKNFIRLAMKIKENNLEIEIIENIINNIILLKKKP